MLDVQLWEIQQQPCCDVVLWDSDRDEPMIYSDLTGYYADNYERYTHYMIITYPKRK